MSIKGMFTSGIVHSHSGWEQGFVFIHKVGQSGMGVGIPYTSITKKFLVLFPCLEFVEPGLVSTSLFISQLVYS